MSYMKRTINLIVYFVYSVNGFYLIFFLTEFYIQKSIKHRIKRVFTALTLLTLLTPLYGTKKLINYDLCGGFLAK